jgi:16S rRNA (adenine1518-N6/adenine1519-N6)-dimethyltransferase
VLKVEPAAELGEEGPVKVIGNIPYNITSPILDWLVNGRSFLSTAVLTVQWEVAQRLTARPGTKAWGALSIFAQVYAEISILRRIGRAHFFPSPNVDSAAVRLVFLPEPRAALGNEEVYFSLVGRAFRKRRKTILNALRDDESRDLGRAPLLAALASASIDPRRRPETLTLEEWAALAALFSQAPGRCSC